MSFLHSIRGFGRSSKTKKKEDSSSPVIRRSQSPTKSPTKQPRFPTSPTKRSKPAAPISAGANTTITSSGSEEPMLFLCEPFVKTALVKGSFKTIVQLPKYVDAGEWLALNIFEMYAHLNSFYGVVSTYCQCPAMTAGANTYLWMDNSGQAVSLPASQYIDYVLTWINAKINDQSVFPTKSGGAFPPNFLKDCKNICRQMFRVFAHIYHSHFDTLVHLSVEAHWNSFFSHFISFVKEYNLIEREELAPMLPLIENFEAQGKIL
ncbi:CBK1 kinase activator protein Mob2p [Diutina catenulata]